MEFLLKNKDLIEALSFLTVIIGVPIGIYQYIRQKRYETYNALDEKYLEYQKLCFENPKLDIFDVPDEKPFFLNEGPKKDEDLKKQELIAFTMLISIFERAYVMYGNHWVKNRQWKGWEQYIRDFCQRENFRDAWESSGETFDSGFQNYMKEKIKEEEPAPKSAKGRRKK